jgi:isoquinoline 1-oxidoreductase alpha subunit
VLRDVLGLTGTKFGCGVGLCGCCSVLIGGQRFFSCQATLRSVGEQNVVTIEGLGDLPLGKRLQDAWVAADVVNAAIASRAS